MYRRDADRKEKSPRGKGGPEDETLLDVGVARRKRLQSEDESLPKIVLSEMGPSWMVPSKMWSSWMCSRQEDRRETRRLSVKKSGGREYGRKSAAF